MPTFSATRREALLSGWMIAVSSIGASRRAASTQALAASVAYPCPCRAGLTWYPTSSTLSPFTCCHVRPQSPTNAPSCVSTIHRPKPSPSYRRRFAAIHAAASLRDFGAG